MKTTTPFDELARAMALRKDPVAEAIETIDPVHLRALRQHQDDLLGPTKLAPGIAEALKTLNSATGSLGVSAATAEAILGYKPGNATMEAALGLKPADALLAAALGYPKGLQDELDRSIAAVVGHDTLYRSPARDVLDQMAHPDIKPANSSRRPSPPQPAATPAMDAGQANPLTVADIGKRVREVRRALGMTQQRFADMAGVGRRFLIELEQGKPSLEIGRVLAVCQAAGIKLGFAA